MRPSHDLSRSLAPFTCDATAIAVVELSQKTWLVGGIIPGINRHPEKKIAPDE
jgi:transposase